MPFWDIVNLLESNDISELKFYYDATEELPASERKSEPILKIRWLSKRLYKNFKKQLLTLERY